MRNGFARPAGVSALQNMVQESGKTPHDGHVELTPSASVTVRSLVILTNTVAATVGGLFVTTGSVAVTALATALTALLVVCIAVNHRM